MKLVHQSKSLKNSILRWGFLLLVVLFLGNAVLPESQIYYGSDLAELVESDDSESEDHKEDRKNEVDSDDFVHGSLSNNFYDYTLQNMATTDQLLSCPPSYDLSTPPPEQA